MAYQSVEQQILGISKEESITPGTRGGAGIIAINRYIPVDKAGTEFNYVPKNIEDEQLRGLFEKYPPTQGRIEGTGKISMDLDALFIGEFFNSLLGGLSTGTVHAGTTPTYTHTFKRSTTLVSLPTYSFFLTRGGASGQAGLQTYALCGVKSLTLSGAVDNKVKVTADIIFKSEADASATIKSAWNPSFTAPTPLMFYHTDYKIATASNTDVVEWNLTIDNGAFPLASFNKAATIKDIHVPGKLLISGGMTILFSSDTERTKFLANTATAIEMDIKHTTPFDVGGAFYPEVDILLNQVHYNAYPFGEHNGLLAAKCTFEAYVSTAGAYAISAAVTNIVVSYVA